MRLTSGFFPIYLIAFITTWSGLATKASAADSIPPGPAVELYRYAKSGGFLVSDFDELLRSALQRLTSSHRREVRVNQLRKAGALNVYVLAPRKLSQEKLSQLPVSTREVLQALEGNAIALPPDVIVIDVHFLSGTIINAFFALTTMGESVEEMAALGADPTSADFVERAGKYAVLASVGRMRYLGRTSFANADIVTAAYMLAGMQKANQESRAGEGYLEYSLAPVLLHEMGHLERKLPARTIISQAASLAEARQEEDMADEYSSQQLTSILRQLQLKSREDYAIALQGILNTVDYLRDGALAQTFRGLRGLDAEDHLAVYEHHDCREPVAYSVPAELMQVGEKARATLIGSEFAAFIRSDQIDGATWDVFPLLTSSELRVLQKRVVTAAKEGSHAHHFLRADRLVQSLTRAATEQKDSDPQTKQEIARLSNEVVGGARHWLLTLLSGQYAEMGDTTPRRGMGLPSETIRKLLGDQFEFSGSPICPTDECLVGILRAGSGGFIEISGPARDVTNIKLVVPIFPVKDGVLDKGKSALSAVLLKVLLEAALGRVPVLPNAEMPAFEAIPFYISLLSGRCGKASIYLDFPRATVRAFTVNERGWLKLIIAGKPFPPAQR